MFKLLEKIRKNKKRKEEMLEMLGKKKLSTEIGEHLVTMLESVWNFFISIAGIYIAIGERLASKPKIVVGLTLLILLFASSFWVYFNFSPTDWAGTFPALFAPIGVLYLAWKAWDNRSHGGLDEISFVIIFFFLLFITAALRVIYGIIFS